MEKEFIPYNEALELKELGFDEPCFSTFFTKDAWQIDCQEGVLNFNNKKPSEYTILAPTFSQAFRWFREKHQMQYRIVSIKHFGKLTFYWNVFSTWEITSVLYNKTSKTYEEAEIECIKELIEIVKNK